MNIAKPLLVVGAGFSGAVVSRELAEAGWMVRVIDSRDHVAGNCHTQRDLATGIMVHVYGPHIFHTSNETVWAYVRRFGEWMPFVNRVKAHTGQGIFGLPINLHTINQFFGQTLAPADARDFLALRADQSIDEPQSFEEQALKFLGRELYEAFFRGYTLKQWGCDPRELPASILKRLPVRFNYNDNYYDSRYQAIPRDGYTQVVENILAHPNITVSLETAWVDTMKQDVEHVFFTGPLDEYYGYAEGRLGYRTVYWESECHTGDYQGNAVINYTSPDVPWTRVHEHKHFAPWESHDQTLVFREFSKETTADDVPYYPKRLSADKAILARYVARAEKETQVSFVGRLATYRYVDMHQVIAEALSFSRRWLEAAAEERPVFSADPQ